MTHRLRKGKQKFSIGRLQHTPPLSRTLQHKDTPAPQDVDADLKASTDDAAKGEVTNMAATRESISAVDFGFTQQPHTSGAMQSSLLGLQSPARSTKGKRSNASSSTSTRQALALKKMEEVHRLQLESLQAREELNKKYIAAKYALMEEEIDVGSSEAESDDMPRGDRRAQTAQWIEKVVHTNEQGIDEQMCNDIKDIKKPERVDEEVRAFPVKPVQTARHSYIGARTTAEFLQAATTGMRAIGISTSRQPLTKRQLEARSVMPKSYPDFDGSPEKWPAFISAVVNQTSICGYDDAENLALLQRALRGRAYESVSGLLTLPGNVPIILSDLHLLFGKPHVLLNSFIEKIEVAPRVEADRLGTLIEFATLVKNMCATMNAANMHDYLNNPKLLDDIVAKLPGSLKLSWAKAALDMEKCSISEFSNWICKEAEAANLVSTMASPGTVHKNITARKSKFTGIVQASSNNKKKQWCVVHNKDSHETHDCRVFVNMSVQKRWRIVKEKKVCIACFGKHFRHECTSNELCNVNGCTERHNKLLHSERQPKQEETVAAHNSTMKNAAKPANTQQAASLFQVVPVTIWGPSGKHISVYAFIDSGSDITMLESKVAHQLELTGPTEHLSLKWTNDVTRSEPSTIVQMEIAGNEPNSTKYIIDRVHVVKRLSLPVQQTSKASELPKHLRQLPLPFEKVQPQMLIGIQHYQLIAPIETKEGAWDEPIAIRTRLGWTVIGHQQHVQHRLRTVNFHTNTTDIELDKLIRNFFELESNGIRPQNTILSDADQRAFKILEETVKETDGKYEAGLLWKSDNVKLPESRPMAEKRFQLLKKKMQSNSKLRVEMHRQINEYLAKGYAQILNDEQVAIHGDRTWYLPIFAVENINKPGKTRIVWDAAATANGVSLNSELLKGPELTSNLLTILLKFREKRVAITGDIQEMFHQVRVAKSDEQSQRFLWSFSDHERPKTLVLKVMTFGATCSPCIAQFVKNRNAERFKDANPRAVEAITDRHYVDDWLDCFDSESECFETTKDVIEIHKAGGFHIRSFMSNSPVVAAGLDTVSTEISKRLKEHNSSLKVLGMWWEPGNDTFQYKVDFRHLDEAVKEKARRPTKREVLSTVMTMFDPLGLIAHRTVGGKMLVQDIWRSGIDWDTQVLGNEYDKWTKWLSTINDLNNVQITRRYFPHKTDFVDLHVFVDAGESAMAAVAYFRCTYGSLTYISLVSGRTKVAPIKTLSIPRLELQAAVLGVRLAKTIEKAHTIAIRRRTFWCDSRNVICWIRSATRKFKPFVAHRIGEILENSNASEWRWVPTKDNVADEATKWKTHRVETDRWLSGPQFLLQDPKKWPLENLEEVFMTDCEDDEQKHCIQTKFRMLVPDPERFSNWRRMVRSMAYALRFFNGTTKKELDLSADEEAEATDHIIRAAQQEAYAEEYTALQAADGKILKRSNLRKLSPFLDENKIVRQRSRIQHAEFYDCDAANPIIMPPRHKITFLLVDSYHRKFMHQNHGAVINVIRERYVVPKLRAMLKTVRRFCHKCRLLGAKPEVPEMSELPRCRLAVYAQPFTYTGVDLFGPMEVAIGRRVEKRWGVVFTCLTTRAIHLEATTALSTDAFILTLRCFVARRVQPRKIYSDNGTNFVGTNNEFRRIWREQIPSAVRENFFTVDWEFIPPGAPHMGGCWERLVRSVKRGLMTAIPTRKPSDQLLRAVLYEIENIINSRPLTYIGEEDQLLALTPNHLLMGSAGAIKPIVPLENLAATYRKGWLYQQHIVATFWKRWLSDYLPSISTRTKWWDPVTPVKAGDVVAVTDDAAVNKWTIGMIVETIPSRDGNVRQVLVKTKGGIQRRPVSRLAVLIKSEDGEKSTASSPRGSVGNSGETQ